MFETVAIDCESGERLRSGNLAKGIGGGWSIVPLTDSVGGIGEEGDRWGDSDGVVTGAAIDPDGFLYGLAHSDGVVSAEGIDDNGQEIGFAREEFLDDIGGGHRIGEACPCRLVESGRASRFVEGDCFGIHDTVGGFVDGVVVLVEGGE